MEAWQALIEAKKRGLVRSIGISNFQPEPMEQLEKKTVELPVVNQIGMHPFFNQADQRKGHEERGIVGVRCSADIGVPARVPAFCYLFAGIDFWTAPFPCNPAFPLSDTGIVIR